MMRRSRGFTLLELLVALTVFALVAVMAYSGLRAVLQGERQTEQYEKRMQAVQTAVLLLETDLQQLVNRPVRDQYGEVQPALVGQDVGAYLLAFTRSGRPNPVGLKRSFLQRVAYGVQDGKLLRYTWPELDRSPRSMSQSATLLSDVRGLKLRFLTPASLWVEQWPPQENSYEEGDDVGMPVAIEVTLETDHPGDIRRLIPLPHGKSQE